MTIKSQYANAIKTYINSHPDAKLGEWPIEISGRVDKRPYYRLPIKLLRYSIDNGRFAAEKLELESQLNRSLDPDILEDVVEIRKMLRDAEPEATEKLKNDLSEKGQLQPGVITADGFLKNGNRRMSIIELLHEEQPTGKWEFIEVVVLPDSVSESDLWRIEAGLQLSQETKLDYGPVNELLKLKEGIDAGMNPASMAAAMYGWTEEKVNEALERLELIDQYLAYSGKSKRYKQIENIHEYFINLQKLIKGWNRNGVSNININEWMLIIFEYICNATKPELKTSHMDIRNMREIFENQKARTIFLDSISQRSLDEHPSKSSPELAYYGYKLAKEIVDIESEKNQPNKLLTTVIHNLEAIVEVVDTQAERFANDENLELLLKVDDLVKTIYKKISTHGNE